ncbi:hypothetical protein [Ruegeria hyattellae]|uniref:hypothetical protein n=1 Tax=Ruegeria hyattellae TaxID=3233337 RepID=UPI00355B4386
MSDPFGDGDRVWDRFLSMPAREKSPQLLLEEKLSQIEPVSSKLLNEYGFALSIVARGGVQSARGLQGLLFRVIESESVEFLCGETFQTNCGYEAVGFLKNRWVTHWRFASSRVKKFTYHIRLRYPLDADPFYVSVAAQNFAADLTGGEFGGDYRFVLVDHQGSGQMYSDLIINRVPISGCTLHLSPYSITPDHLRRLFLTNLYEAGAVDSRIGPSSFGSDKDHAETDAGPAR